MMPHQAWVQWVVLAAVLLALVLWLGFRWLDATRLRVRRARMAAAEAARQRRERRRRLQDEETGRALAAAAATRTRRPVVLWVNGDRDANAGIAAYLDARAYRAITADNGRQALAVLQGTSPDVMVCNVDLREISGLHLLDIVREDIVLSGLPVMLLSSRQDFTAQAASRLGADGFLRWPCPPEDILEQIRFLLQE